MNTTLSGAQAKQARQGLERRLRRPAGAGRAAPGDGRRLLFADAAA